MKEYKADVNTEVNTFNKTIVVIIAPHSEQQQGLIRGIEAINETINYKLSIVHAAPAFDVTTQLLADSLNATIITTVPVTNYDSNKVILINDLPEECNREVISEFIINNYKDVIDKL